MKQETGYVFLDRLFLRSPFYSAQAYDPDKMIEIVLQRDFQNALLLASPELYAELVKKHFDWSQFAKSERLSLLKYYNRMSFRATPFGAFSSFSVVHWDNQDTVRLAEASRSILHLLPSRQWQFARHQLLKATCADLSLQKNPTLIQLGDRFSLVRSEVDSKGKMQFALNSIGAQELNKKLIDFARNRSVSWSALHHLTMELTGCSAREAREYMDFLVSEKVFLTEFEGNLIETASGTVDHLTAKTTVIFNDRLEMDQQIRQFLGRDQLPDFKGNVFYSGLERPVQEGGISREWQEEIADVVHMLRKMIIPHPTPALKDFCAAFKSKFDGQSVPLLLALDPDTGIIYDRLYGSSGKNNLLDGLFFPVVQRETKRIDWTPVHRMILGLWQRNTGDRPYRPLVITAADLATLEPFGKQAQSPPSMAFLFSRTSEKLVLDSNGGATATAILGRFSVFSNDVEALCRDIALAETTANPGVIFAELHQLSDTHVDNINRRKPVYDYVIPINSWPVNSGQKVIELNDLVLSAQGDEMVLESLSLKKRIIPRLPTAYNFHHSGMAIFRFLCDLQYQGLQANLTLDLEKLFPGLDFYPRVEFQKTVLTLAKWRLSKKEIDLLTDNRFSIGRLHQFRTSRGIPQHITMGVSDRQLAFQLDSDKQASFFLECLKGMSSALIRELPETDRSVTAGKQKMSGQFIAFMTMDDQVYKPMPKKVRGFKTGIQRSFLPGSEWIYLKIYCTYESADYLLNNVVHYFMTVNKSKIRNWFFIRYQDPDPHIRLRMRVEPTDYGLIMKSLKSALSKKAVALRIREVYQDTYHRELERYGHELIELSENCFCAGSLLAIEWLKMDNDAVPGFDLAAFKLVYDVASMFIIDRKELAEFLNSRSTAFMLEFGITSEFRLSLDRKYRTLSKRLSLVIESPIEFSERKEFREAYDAFLQKVGAIVARCGSWTAQRRYALAADLIHMQVNRIFNQQQRQHEALLYFCLSKYIISALARHQR